MSEIRRRLDEHRNNNWSALLEQVDGEGESQALWRLRKRLKKSKSLKSPIHGAEGVVFTDKRKAEAFAISLENQFSPNRDRDDDLQWKELAENGFNTLRRNRQAQPIRPCTVIATKSILDSLNIRKAPDGEGITNRQLKELPIAYVNYIANIANDILRTQSYPDVWKNAFVIMLTEQWKNPILPQNYIPIGLLSSMAKVVEKIIPTRLVDECDEKYIVLDEQYGFRAGHSTEQQALRLAENIIASVNGGYSCSALFVNVEKVFDKVWQEGLVYNMSDLGISNGICRLVASFLLNRTFQVKIG